MLAIFEKIRRPATDAADLRQRHGEVAETIPALEAEVRRQQQRRADGLLSLSDREVERIEQELALAVRNRDRALAALDELERRAGEAEEAEARQPVEAAIAAAEKRAAAFAISFFKKHDLAAGPLAALMQEFAEIERQVFEANSASLEFHSQRGTAASAPAPVRTVADRISGPHLTATKIMAGDAQPGFGLAQQ